MNACRAMRANPDAHRSGRGTTLWEAQTDDAAAYETAFVAIAHSFGRSLLFFWEHVTIRKGAAGKRLVGPL